MLLASLSIVDDIFLHRVWIALASVCVSSFKASSVWPQPLLTMTQSDAPSKAERETESVMNHVPWRENVLNSTRTLQHDNFLSQQPISI